MSLNALPPTLLIIIGITGDLAHRKLLPALAEIVRTGHQPEKFKVIGVSRSSVTPEDIFSKTKSEDVRNSLQGVLETYQLDLDDTEQYKKFGEYLSGYDTNFGQDAQRLFYLSVPPTVSRSIIESLSKSGIAAHEQTKLLLEKPFGTDAASASELIKTTNQLFDESQLYRIDHFLAKEMAQNILVFRSSNSLFKRTWNKDFIDRIEITASESIGIEGRAVFYEQTGALRDIVQSHLLQLAALVLMDLPTKDEWNQVAKLRLDALRNLKSDNTAVRGQYDGYKQEVSNLKSNVETYASLTLFSDDDDWLGVPITLTTGKALEKTFTEICIHYKQEESSESNRLVLRIQPNEGIEVYLWSKRPGFEHKLDKVTLDFTYDEHFSDLPDAYERVLVDAIKSDHSLFASSDEVIASWRILTPIQEAWSKNSDDLIIYKPGSKAEELRPN